MNLAIFEGVKVIVEVLRDFELEFAEGWSVEHLTSFARMHLHLSDSGFCPFLQN
jgi:hypothetical protein